MSFFSRELPIDECECPGRREGLCEQRRILRKVHRQLLASVNKTAHAKLSELLVALYSPSPCPVLAQYIGEFLIEIGTHVDGRRSIWGSSDWMHGQHARVAGPCKSRLSRRLDPEIRQSVREQVEEGSARSMHAAASAVHLPEGTSERFVRANVLEYQFATVGAFRVARDATLSVAVDAARLRRPGKEYLQGVVSAVGGDTVFGAATVPATSVRPKNRLAACDNTIRSQELLSSAVQRKLIAAIRNHPSKARAIWELMPGLGIDDTNYDAPEQDVKVSRQKAVQLKRKQSMTEQKNEEKEKARHGGQTAYSRRSDYRLENDGSTDEGSLGGPWGQQSQSCEFEPLGKARGQGGLSGDH
eukprot:2706124-Amphidinium_carterae.3